MSTALLITRLVLAVAFSIASIGKLLDLSGSVRAARDFGIPVPLAGIAGIGLPFVEGGVALALLWPATALGGAIAASLLLLAFMVLIARALARGERPDCHCFGQIHSAPAGRPALARDAVLLALAGFIVVAGAHDPGPGATGWLSALRPAELVLAGCVVFLSWFAIALLRQQGRLLIRLEALEETFASPAQQTTRPAGLEVGSLAPAFELPALDGGTRSLQEILGDGRPALLVFSDPHCGPCEELLPDVTRWQRDHADHISVVLVSRGTAERNEAMRSTYGAGLVLLQEDRELSLLYEAHGTPAAVLISPDGRVASPVARGAGEIRATVATALGARDVLDVRAQTSNTIGVPA